MTGLYDGQTLMTYGELGVDLVSLDDVVLEALGQISALTDVEFQKMTRETVLLEEDVVARDGLGDRVNTFWVCVRLAYTGAVRGRGRRTRRLAQLRVVVRGLEALGG